jgi:competence protein ComEA
MFRPLFVFIAPWMMSSLLFVQPVHAATPVNINTADAQTLADSLDGIGLTKAEAIVAQREAHGPYKNVDELAQVKGISASLIERNRDALRLADAAPAASKAAAKSAKARE